jgi:hypothetical protein
MIWDYFNPRSSHPGAFSIPIESEWGSNSLFNRIFATQTGIQPRLRGAVLCWKML